MITDLHKVLWEPRDERSSTNQSWKAGESENTPGGVPEVALKRWVEVSLAKE